MKTQLLWTGVAAAWCLFSFADAHAQSPQTRPARDECCATTLPDGPAENRPRARGQTPPRQSPTRPPRNGLPQREPGLNGQMQTSHGVCPDPTLFGVRIGVFEITQREAQQMMVSNLSDFELGSVNQPSNNQSFVYAQIQAGAGSALCYYSIEDTDLRFNLVSHGSNCLPDANNVWSSVEGGALRCTESRTACRFECE